MAPGKPDRKTQIRQGITLDRGAKARTIIQIGAFNIDVSKRLLAGLLFALLVQSGIIAAGFLKISSQLNNSPKGEMTGAFNFAVSPFGQLDEDGRVIASAKGERMAEEAYQVVVKNFEASGLDYDKRAPGDAVILADPSISKAVFEEKVEELADKLKADLVFYGYLESDQKKLTLKAYINAYRMPNARDLTDHYPIDDPSTKESVEANQAAYKEMLRQITNQSESLANFGLGLGYFSMDQITTSLVFFDLAGAEATAHDLRKVIYLFQSKIYLAQDDIDGAKRYLEQALELDETYLRAWLELGQLEYLRASHLCSETAPKLETEEPAPEDRMLAFQAFEDAIQHFGEARERDLDRPEPEAYILIKADYYIGRVYHCMSTAGLEDHWQEARCKYWSVIYAAGYEPDWLADCTEKPPVIDSSSSVTRDLAAIAYTDLALLNWQQGWNVELQGDPTEAESYYTNTEKYLLKAIEISDHFDERALSHTMLADFYQKHDQCEAAKQHLQLASHQYFDNYLNLNKDFPIKKFEAFYAEVQNGNNCLCFNKC